MKIPTGNAAMMSLDKVLKMGFAFLTAMLLARYFGVEQFGYYSSIVVIVSLLGPLYTFSMDLIVSREMIRHPSELPKILGSAIALRLIGWFVAAILVACYGLFVVNDTHFLAFSLVFLLSFLPQSCYVIDYVYQIKSQYKYVLVAYAVGQTGGLLLRLGAIYWHLDMAWFLAIAIVEAALVVMVNTLTAYHLKFARPVISRQMMKTIALEARSLIVSGFIVVSYMKLDQILVVNLLGEKSMGLYAVSARITDAVVILMSTLVAAASLNLTRYHANLSPVDFHKKLIEEGRRLLRISLGLVIAVLLVSVVFIPLGFGEQYKDAIYVLLISVWCGVFVTVGGVGSRWLSLHGKSHLLIRRSIIGLTVAIVAGTTLIPLLGLTGAACTILLVQFFSCYLSNALSKDTRELFRAQTDIFLLFKKI